MTRAEANNSQTKAQLDRWRAEDPAFAYWAQGYGVIRHSDLTQARIHGMEIHLLSAKFRVTACLSTIFSTLWIG
jgi:hypothetical protein